jgi:hypothetical protein
MADNIKLSDLLKGSGYEETPKEVKKYSDIQLAPGKKIVLQAQSDSDPRGLVVTWRKDGGYDVAYWYDKPTNIVPAELKGDGKSFGDIKNVYLGFHPELDDDGNSY